VILENIRITLNLNRNSNIFMNTVNVGLKGIETISTYSGYDITGLTEEIMKDEDFLLDLKIISCELDISKYINPKSSAFIKLVKKIYSKNQENKIKNEMNKVINNPDKIEKILNLKINKEK
jgi:hypothetical protein